MSACPHCDVGLIREDVMRWERSRSFDHDYYGPVDRGEVSLVRCMLSHSYHYVAPNGLPQPRWTYWMGKAPA